MAEKPIIFSGPMVRALMLGQKTQTRRVIKAGGSLPDFCGAGGQDSPDWNDPTCWGWEDHEHGDWVTLERDPGQRMSWRDWRGAFHVGDRLWVREAHAFVPAAAYRNSLFVEQRADPDDPDRAAIYREGFDLSRGGIRWRSSIHMPRWASRLTLVVRDVRVQRVQEISEEDARAEGVQLRRAPEGNEVVEWTAVQSFADVWNSIHGRGAWDANPWVCALTFTVHRCNIDAMGAA